ncbi:hypothetical protein FRC18_003714 [Serendipita sp. 400]|nr:hypothetical protein FRC18_003714 [Serendipita sp. 400]
MQKTVNENEHDQQMPCQSPPFFPPSVHYPQASFQAYTPYYGPHITTLGHDPVHRDITRDAANSHHPVACASPPPYTNSPTSLLNINGPYWDNNATSQTQNVAMHYQIQQMRSPQGFSSPSSVSVPFVHLAQQYHSPPWELPMGTNGLMHNGHYGSSVPPQLDHSFQYQLQPDPTASQPPLSLDYFSPSTNTFEGDILNDYYLSSAQTDSYPAESNPWNHVAPEMLTETSSSAPSPHAMTIESGRSSPALPANFVDVSFPLPTGDHPRLRERLREVMDSDWKLEDRLESDRNHILQFTPQDSTSGNFSCLFWGDSIPCRRTFSKSQHALTHVRKHIQHRPYVCDPICPFNGKPCSKRFTTKSVLKNHKRGKIQCKFCRKFMRAHNLRRHHTHSCKGRPMA